MGEQARSTAKMAILGCNLAPEEHLVLMLSRTPFPDGAAREAEAFLRGHPIDQGKFLALARMNRVSPLLYLNLEKLDCVPEDLLGELKKAYLVTLRNNLLHARETVKIIRLLEDAGVESIPLKGSLASEMIFGDIGLYPTGDIDLIVRPSSLEKAKEALLRSGYSESYEQNEDDFLESSYHLIFHDNTYSVELHWNLVKWVFEVSPGFWWEETMKAGYDGREITLLSPERYILYAVFHLFTHRFSPLKFFLLVTGLINKHQNDIDWGKLLACSKRPGMKRLTIFTLKLVYDLLGAGIPGSITNRRIAGYSLLRKVILSGLFREVTRSYVRLALFTVLLDTPLDTAKVLLRRVFPPLSEIRLRYRLPEGSRKVYGYYLLNPLLMIMRKSG